MSVVRTLAAILCDVLGSTVVCSPLAGIANRTRSKLGSRLLRFAPCVCMQLLVGVRARWHNTAVAGQLVFCVLLNWGMWQCLLAAVLGHTHPTVVSTYVHT